MTRLAAAVAAVCWLALPAGIALILLDPKQGWIGVTVIFGALLAGIPVLAWSRRGQQPEDDGWAPMNRPEDPYGCHRGDQEGPR